jgi:hypothetical protein
MGIIFPRGRISESEDGTEGVGGKKRMKEVAMGENTMKEETKREKMCMVCLAWCIFHPHSAGLQEGAEKVTFGESIKTGLWIRGKGRGRGV